MPGEPLRPGRLLLYLFPLAGLAVAAFLVLPSGLVKLVVLGVIALPAGIILFDRPQWIFCIFVFVLFSNIDIFAPFGIFRYVLLFLLVTFAVAVVMGRRLVVHDRVFLILVCAFLILVFQSISFALKLEGSLNTLGKLFRALVSTAIAMQFVRSRKEFRTFLLALTLAILMNNFLPFIVRPPVEQSPLSLLWEQGVLRYEGFVLEANRFAMLQNFFLPLLLFLFVYYRKPWFARTFFLVAFLASVFVLVLSFSRSGFLSFMIILAGLVIMERRRWYVPVVALVVIIAGVALAPGVYWERITSLTDTDPTGVASAAVVQRIESGRVALLLGLRNPLLGVGLGNFIYAASFYIPYRIIVHNAFLQIFSEIGMIGFAVFLCIILYNLKLTRSLIRRRRDPEAVILGKLLIIQQAAYFFNSLFIPVAWTNFFWFALALPAMAVYAYREGPEGVAAPIGRD